MEDNYIKIYPINKMYSIHQHSLHSASRCYLQISLEALYFRIYTITEKKITHNGISYANRGFQNCSMLAG